MNYLINELMNESINESIREYLHLPPGRAHIDHRTRPSGSRHQRNPENTWKIIPITSVHREVITKGTIDTLEVNYIVYGTKEIKQSLH